MLDPTGTNLYKAVDQLYDQQLKTIIKEVVPEAVAQEAEKGKMVAVTKALGKFVWNLLQPSEADSGLQQIANKVVKLKLLEKINRLNTLEDSYNALDSDPSNDVYSQVRHLADGDALYAQKLEIANTLMAILSNDPTAEFGAEKNSLAGRIHELKTTYKLEATKVSKETGIYSATRDIFVTIFKDALRDMPPIPYHTPTLDAADSEEATEIMIDGILEKIAIFKRTIESGREPKSNRKLSENDKEQLKKLVLEHQDKLIHLLEKERAQIQARLSVIHAFHSLRETLGRQLGGIEGHIAQVQRESERPRELQRRVAELQELDIERLHQQNLSESRIQKLIDDYEFHQGKVASPLDLQALRDQIAAEERQAQINDIGHETQIVQKQQEHIQHEIDGLRTDIASMGPSPEKTKLEGQVLHLEETAAFLTKRMTQLAQRQQLASLPVESLAALHTAQTQRINALINTPGTDLELAKLKLADLENRMEQNRMEFLRRKENKTLKANIEARWQELNNRSRTQPFTLAQSRERDIIEEGIRIEQLLNEHTDVDAQQKIASERLQFLQAYIPKLQAHGNASDVRVYSDEIARLQEVVKRLDTENRARLQDLNERRILLNVKADLLKNMTPAEQRQRLKDGNYLSSAVDRTIQGLIKGTDVDWQNEEWVQFLFRETEKPQGVVAQVKSSLTGWKNYWMGSVSFETFKTQINAHKINARRIETLKQDKDSQIQELEKRKRELPFSTLTLDERTATAEQCDKEIEALEEQWRELNSEERWVQLAIRGAFIKRITAEIKQRYIAQREIAANQKRVLEQLTPGEPRSQADENSIRRFDKQMSENLRAIEALERGFVKQINQYRGIEPPGDFIFKRMAKAAGAGLRNPRGSLALMNELFFPQNYDDPNRLQCEHNFAQLGYTYEEGLKQIGLIHYTGTFVEEFLRFADNHPESAEAIMADIAVALGAAFGKGPMDQILQGLDWRRRAGVTLGNVSRSGTPVPMEKSDFKFLALAEMAHAGPERIAQLKAMWTFTTYVAPALLTFSPTAIVTAAVAGVASGATEIAAVKTVQTLVQGAKKKDLQAWSIFLQLANSRPAMEVLEEQRTLAGLELFGVCKDLIIRPKALVERIEGGISDAWKLLKKSWDKPDSREFTMRFITTVAMPAVLTGSALLLLIFSGPIGIGFAITTAFACLSFAGIAGRFFYARLNSLYPSTVLALQKDNAREFLTDHLKYRLELITTRNDFVDSLKRRQMLPSFQLNERMERQAARLKSDTDLLRIEFESILTENIRIAKKLNNDLPVTPEKVLAIYHKVRNDFKFGEKCDALSLSSSFPDREGFARDLEARILGPLFDKTTPGQVMTWMDEGFESQFLFEVASYPNPMEFSRKKAEHTRKLAEAKQRLEEAVKKVQAGEGGPQAAAMLDPAWELDE